MNGERIVSLVLLAYLAGAVFTNGLYAANNEERCGALYSNDSNSPGIKRSSGWNAKKRNKCTWGADGLMAAVFWPLYWPAKLTYVIARD